MLLDSKRLANIPVRTKSGMKVGRLASADFDADTGKITTLHVRVPGVVPHLFDNELLVAWTQVISMSDKEIVVADASVPAGSRLLAKGLTQRAT